MSKVADSRSAPVQSSQRGFTLIEVLVGLLLFSFGILGFVGMQARAVQLSVDSEDRNRAALMANELVTTMLLNHTTDVDTSGWLSRLRDATVSGLPQASGAVSAADANGVVTLTITWKSPSAPAAAASSSYSTDVVVVP
jgi:type IV pilus assembly protein PilV